MSTRTIAGNVETEFSIIRDSLHAELWNKKIIEEYVYNNLDTAIQYNNALLQFSKKTNNKFFEGQALFNFGKIYSFKEANIKALDFYKKSYSVGKSISDESLMAQAIMRIGVIYSNQGKIAIAIKNLEESYHLFEKIGNKRGAMESLLGISIIHGENNNPVAARSYCLDVINKVRDEKIDYDLSNTLMILAINYVKINRDSSFILLEEATLIANEQNDTIALIDMKRAKAEIFRILGDYDKAIVAYQQVISAKESINISDGLPDLYCRIAEIQWRKNKKTIALKNVLKAKALLPIANDVEEVLLVYKLLATFYKDNGSYKLATENLENYYALRDSLKGESNSKLLIRQQLQYEYDNQTFADSIENNTKLLVKETELAKEKVLREKSQDRNFFLGWIVFLIAGSVLFILNRIRIINKQKKTIEQQKVLVDNAYEKISKKNTEITDSMTYAKRIQSAMLPDTSLFSKKLPNSFALYLPKDIISGDFYWLNETEAGLLFAVADCTGHGIPGAMVSILCNNSLNRAVQVTENDPALILDETRSILITELENDDTKLKDGMDIALCKLDGDNLYFSGANSPLWCVRKGELIEVRPDKQPVANYEKLSAFTTKHLKVQKNDMIYLFTDGFVDQFGGPKGKKFKYKPLRELLKGISTLPENEQKEVLEETLITWRGDNEQVDDICIVGVRI